MNFRLQSLCTMAYFMHRYLASKNVNRIYECSIDPDRKNI